MKAANIDDKRRVVLPPKWRPHSAVTIQELDDTTLLIKRQVPSRKFKTVVFPVVDRLPDDPEWEKVEEAFARHASKNLPEPEE
jgi:DNA-binding transcriptional regulator/RsmH inhibitor MraZ